MLQQLSPELISDNAFNERIYQQERGLITQHQEVLFDEISKFAPAQRLHKGGQLTTQSSSTGQLIMLWA